MSDDQRRLVEDNLNRLAAWACSITLDQIPDDIKRRAALVIADDIACVAGSRDEAEVLALKNSLQTGSREASVFLGGEDKFDRADAAMINSIASNWCQLDEGHREVMCHAGLYVVPAAAAEAEAADRSVKDMLRATIIGYEIVCRFARTFRFPKPAAHPHAMWSALGAAATLAALRNFDENRFVNAMTAAVTMTAAGPFGHAVSGALVANAWAGLGVASGFRCAQLAACGIGGHGGSPFDVFSTVLGADVHADALTADIGDAWMLSGGYHKAYSCAQQSHAAVEATLALSGRLRSGSIGTQRINRIIVEGHRLALSMDNRAPTTTLAARFSIPHIVAATCVSGHANASAFALDIPQADEIARLRSLVELKLLSPEPAPPWDRAARVTFFLSEGTTMAEQCLSAQGGPDRPLGLSRVIEKCDQLAGRAYPSFGRVAAGFCALDEATMNRSWRDLTRALTRQ